MLSFPWGGHHQDEPGSWDECQEFMERPRMRNESEGDYKARLSTAKLSSQIIEALQRVNRNMRWAA